MEIKILNHAEILEQKESILNFYVSVYQTTRDHYRKAIENTYLACVLIDENNRIWGSCRILTDFSKHAHIIDFIIDPSMQKHGWGSKILEQAAKKCKQLGCRYIGLTCAKELFDFYAKNNFKTVEGFNYLKFEG